jgi:site-specific recombinase XerD
MPTPTGHALIERYLATRIDLTASSRDGYFADLLSAETELPTGGLLTADREALSRWLETKMRNVRDPNDERPWGRARAQRMLAALRGWYQWAVETHVVTADPTTGMKLRAPKRAAPTRYSREEILQLFEAARQDLDHHRLSDDTDVFQHRLHAYAILHLCYYLGLRVSEATGILRRDVNRSTVPWEIVILGKGEHRDTMFVHPPLTDVVDLVLHHRPATQAGHEPYLLINAHTGRAWTRMAVGQQLVRWAISAGWSAERVSGFSPHKLRHSVGYHLADTGMPLIDIKEFFRHRNLATTQIYTEHDRAGSERARARAAHVLNTPERGHA